MASRIKAISAYRPRLVLGKRADMDDLVEFIAGRTGLNESGVRQGLLELRDAVMFFNMQGRAVYLEGLGTFFPTISLDGTYGVGHRADNALKNGYNAPGAFRGDIVNRENIGQTSQQLIDRWNVENPGDPVLEV